MRIFKQWNTMGKKLVNNPSGINYYLLFFSFSEQICWCANLWVVNVSYAQCKRMLPWFEVANLPCQATKEKFSTGNGGQRGGRSVELTWRIIARTVFAARLSSCNEARAANGERRGREVGNKKKKEKLKVKQSIDSSCTCLPLFCTMKAKGFQSLPFCLPFPIVYFYTVFFLYHLHRKPTPARRTGGDIAERSPLIFLFLFLPTQNSSCSKEERWVRRRVKGTATITRSKYCWLATPAWGRAASSSASSPTMSTTSRQPSVRITQPSIALLLNSPPQTCSSFPINLCRLSYFELFDLLVLLILLF